MKKIIFVTLAMLVVIGSFCGCKSITKEENPLEGTWENSDYSTTMTQVFENGVVTTEIDGMETGKLAYKIADTVKDGDKTTLTLTITDDSLEYDSEVVIENDKMTYENLEYTKVTK